MTTGSREVTLNENLTQLKRFYCVILIICIRNIAFLITSDINLKI